MPGYPSPVETTRGPADEALCPQHLAVALLADNYVNVPVPRVDAAYIEVNAHSRGSVRLGGTGSRNPPPTPDARAVCPDAQAT